MATPDEAWVRGALRAVGYQFVQFEASFPGIDPKYRPAVLAWASDANGKLVPWAVIEVKNSSGRVPPPPIQIALPQLARGRDSLGTVEHYVVRDEQWFKADPGLRTLEGVEGPTPPEYGGRGRIEDVDLATALVSEGLYQWADRTRRRGVAPQIDDYRSQHSVELRIGGIETPNGDVMPASREVLWEARRRALVDFGRRGPARELGVSHSVVATAVATLAGRRLDSDVFDPFCGAGSFLWEAVERARELGKGLNTVRGYDIDPWIVQLASTIGASAPIPVEISQQDALQVRGPLSSAIVSSPPAGVRLPERRQLLDDSYTHELEAAAIDQAVRLLAPAGRAVLHVSSGFTFRSNLEGFRQYLAHNYRMAAVIGLPSGAVPGMQIRSVILVIDNTVPGPTFVAQLGEDWETQLAPGGAALHAALEFVDRRDDPSAGEP